MKLPNRKISHQPIAKLLLLALATSGVCAFLAACSTPSQRHDARVDSRVDNRVDNRMERRHDRRNDRW